MRTDRCGRALQTMMVLAVAFGVGCDESVSSGTVRIAFVDGSASTRDQAAHWLAALKARLLDRLEFGDAVIVYGISDRTAERAPLFEDEIPPRGDGMLEEVNARETLARVQSEALRQVQRFLSDVQPSAHTEIMGAIRLIPIGSPRPVHVLYLSDGIESTASLDLEKTAVINPDALARRIADMHHLSHGALRGVTISFVLDSPASGAGRRLNSRRALEDLFRALYENHLGARIDTFDSRTQGVGIQQVGAE